MTTIVHALRAATARLTLMSDSASLDAQLLLAHVMGVERAILLAYPERELTDAQITAFEALIARAAAGEPIAYIVGRRAWYDMDLIVTPAVLIPRWETEQVLELALEHLNPQPLLHSGEGALRAVDVGTGSGALAAGLKKHRPQVEVHAVDISADALDVARANAAKYGVDVQFHQGDLLTPFLSPPSLRSGEGGRGGEVNSGEVAFNLILANLPYIASDALPALAVSKYEPRLALDGGTDGLALIRRLLTQIADGDLIRLGGCILLEIGADQGAAAAALARTTFARGKVAVVVDLAGRDRIVRIEV
ncbi:MAG: peptide chain release factor N(5)-glutamine methyltransferase [Chloroflexota bacterium]|nr:peptide chain release factor N(5)-glutamine methyltransferase [Chloroflexota bacterium]